MLEARVVDERRENVGHAAPDPPPELAAGEPERLALEHAGQIVSKSSAHRSASKSSSD
jgi:hypothetical protein